MTCCRAPKPVSILFLIDTSGSMSAELSGVKQSGLAFAQRVMASGVSCRLGLMDFDLDPTLSYRWEIFGPMDPQQFPAAIAGLRIGRLGGCGCYIGNPDTIPVIAAFADAMRVEDGLRVGVLIGDEVGQHGQAVRQIVSLLQQAEVTMHVVGVAGSCHELIAAETGGRFWNIAASRGHVDFSSLLDAVATEISNLAAEGPRGARRTATFLTGGQQMPEEKPAGSDELEKLEEPGEQFADPDAASAGDAAAQTAPGSEPSETAAEAGGPVPADQLLRRESHDWRKRSPESSSGWKPLPNCPRSRGRPWRS